MARITVEDCIDKVEGPYDLVLIAKERAVQLNSGEKPHVKREKDKNTVIALKEIAENKVSVKDLKDAAIKKLRKHIAQDTNVLDQDESEGDDFENIYKGQVSKSGISILPSKRARKIPEKIDIFKSDMEKVQKKENEKDNLSKEKEVSLENLEVKKNTQQNLDEIENLKEVDNPETSNST